MIPLFAVIAKSGDERLTVHKFKSLVELHLFARIVRSALDHAVWEKEVVMLTLLPHINQPNFSCPVVEVLEQMEVDGSKFIEVCGSQ